MPELLILADIKEEIVFLKPIYITFVTFEKFSIKEENEINA